MPRLMLTLLSVAMLGGCSFTVEEEPAFDPGGPPEFVIRLGERVVCESASSEDCAFEFLTLQAGEDGASATLTFENDAAEAVSFPRIAFPETSQEFRVLEPVPSGCERNQTADIMVSVAPATLGVLEGTFAIDATGADSGLTTTMEIAASVMVVP